MRENEPWVNLELVTKSPRTHDILISFIIDMPKFLVAEFNTHRMISRNSASTRAIPLKVQLERIGGEEMFVPPVLFENCKGMAGKTLMSPEDYDEVEKLIINQYHKCTEPFISLLADKRVHKQHAGRYVEPWMWTRVLATANIEWWEDFVRQRYSPAAQPEIQRIASEINQQLKLVKETYDNYAFWHIPLLTDEERTTVSRLPQWVSPDFNLEWNQIDTREDILWWCAVASARCARISYLNEKGERSYDDGMDLFSRLLKDGHMSPFEHVARVINPKKDKGIYFREGYGLMDNNFTGFYQYRTMLKHTS
jgi:thymidylate synthase ThyX